MMVALPEHMRLFEGHGVRVYAGKPRVRVTQFPTALPVIAHPLMRRDVNIYANAQ